MTKFVGNNKFYKVAFLKLYCLIGKFVLQILTSHDFFSLVTTQFLLKYTAQQGGVQQELRQFCYQVRLWGHVWLVKFTVVLSPLLQ